MFHWIYTFYNQDKVDGYTGRAETKSFLISAVITYLVYLPGLPRIKSHRFSLALCKSLFFKKRQYYIVWIYEGLSAPSNHNEKVLGNYSANGITFLSCFFRKKNICGIRVSNCSAVMFQVCYQSISFSKTFCFTPNIIG